MSVEATKSIKIPEVYAFIICLKLLKSFWSILCSEIHHAIYILIFAGLSVIVSFYIIYSVLSLIMYTKNSLHIQ
jgi:hypothetical protein